LNPIAIRAAGVGKRYRLAPPQGYSSLRESLMRVLSSPLARKQSGGDETFWALADVSFELRHGEVIGIIGRNGAGKSTLLKILSRITEPTTGRIVIGGRVASLLEVGTGFHPELTGRENIYLNGAILGMRREDIRRRFDEIVAFAEVERFLDTSVKHYSSGMYMRLAFSVAAHLEPDILLVDEVLAVGDNAFQRKCLTKMESVGKHGRTVIFVSHSMAAITRLCPRTLLFDRGQLQADGDTASVVRTYLSTGLGTSAARDWGESARPGNDIVRLRAVRVRTEEGRIEEAVDIRRPVTIEMDYDVVGAGSVLVPNLHLFNDEGVCLFVSQDLSPAWRRTPRPVGSFRSVATIPGNFLAEGTITVTAAISTIDPVIVHVNEPDSVAFQVVDKGDGDSVRGDYRGQLPGAVRPMLSWTTSELAESDAASAPKATA
jgi:lipopolysaccharide transport system ATP-binding protein